MSDKGLPIVLKLDNEQTEKDWERYEELLAAEQERAQSGQLRPYSIRFAHSGDNECWDTYEGWQIDNEDREATEDEDHSEEGKQHIPHKKRKQVGIL